ncbi:MULTISPECIES: ubiquinol oxidase subunit II [unclassified Achromobacter]|uniref:ubiquinol oxidase subunit II n=1 Tax=unclassified Achromobacter TaxID=2626865 RepID=UPI000B51E180|nr:MULTISPECIES: ubiquinol oxidase subunit II [unclassified Achromobacter]OWT72929.1 ubiquinol oxidase subunit II [Achromobacter sp. HZ34]OWT74147.1 ubiquinol oxidase subunit II [Achromobacter sp. HZ28]
MPPYKPPRGLLLLPLLAATLLLGGCNAVLLSPSGDIAVQQRDLIIISTILMLVIIIPVIILTLVFAYRYRAAANNPDYDPEWNHSTRIELMVWSAPLIIIIALGAITWVSTHRLDPYRPLDRVSEGRELPTNVKPLVVEVVSMDWKWLFIYPEQGIATVNELAAPVDRPIQFKLTSTTVMNAFFVPALAGMIYTMPGMETQLHAVINKSGTYDGMSSNFSGAGFSGMRFKFYGMPAGDFDKWVQQAREGGNTLDRPTYVELDKPSERVPVQRYGKVAADLYDAILNRCVLAGQTCMKDQMAMDQRANKGLSGRYSLANNDLSAREYLGSICTSSNPTGAGVLENKVL